MNLINVVAPIYNEQGNIREFVKRVIVSLSSLTDDYKILLIDDGSIDKSWEIIIEICKSHDKVKGFKLSKNFGHHHAITAGIHKSKSEWVIVMDSDLQDRPEVIPELFNKAQEGFDIVFVSRTDRPEKIWYRITQKIFYFILNLLSGIKFDSTQANFSIINKKVVDAYMTFNEQARFYGSTIKWLGFKRTSIKAQHGYRYFGKPSYTLKKRFRLAAEIILAFSDRPLKLAIFLGMTISLLSILSLAINVIFIFSNDYIFSFLYLLIIFFIFMMGVLISLVGILGVYLGKVFSQTKNRPLYLIEESIN